MLGTVLRQQGKPDEALAELRETVRLQPRSAEAHLGIGQMLRQRGDAAGAAAAFAEAERLNKRKADDQAATFAVSAGLKKLAAKDLSGAIASFREAVRLAPDQAQAQYQLGLALRKAGRPRRPGSTWRRRGVWRPTWPRPTRRTDGGRSGLGWLEPGRA